MSSYPKWLYHQTKEPALVVDEAAHKALGPGWVESPADAKAPKAEAKPEAKEEKPAKQVK